MAASGTFPVKGTSKTRLGRGTLLLGQIKAKAQAAAVAAAAAVAGASEAGRAQRSSASSPPQVSLIDANDPRIACMCNLGIAPGTARLALSQKNGSINEALDWLFDEHKREELHGVEASQPIATTPRQETCAAACARDRGAVASPRPNRRSLSAQGPRLSYDGRGLGMGTACLSGREVGHRRRSSGRRRRPSNGASRGCPRNEPSAGDPRCEGRLEDCDRAANIIANGKVQHDQQLGEVCAGVAHIAPNDEAQDDKELEQVPGLLVADTLAPTDPTDTLGAASAEGVASSASHSDGGEDEATNRNSHGDLEAAAHDLLLREFDEQEADMLLAPDISSWEWPLSRHEKKQRVLLIERRMHLIDRKALERQLGELRGNKDTSADCLADSA